MTSKIIIILLTITTVCTSAIAENKVKGTVVDKFTGLPIEGVNIRIEHTLDGATTDSHGEFVLADLLPGSILKLSHVSYISRSFTVPGTADTVLIEMEPSYINLSQVVVSATGTHRRQNEAPVPTTVLTSKDIADAGVTTLSEALIKLDPSVSVTPLGSMGTSISMNGLEDTYMLFMINGRRLIGSGTGAPDLSRIDMSNIKRIEILDGAASMLYGSDAIAGVINIITDDIRSGVELSSQASVRNHGRYEQSVNLDAKEGRLGTYTSYYHSEAGGWQLNPMEEDETGALVPSTRLASFANRSNSISQKFTYDFTKTLTAYVQGSWYGFREFRPDSLNSLPTTYQYDMLHRNYSYGGGIKYLLNNDISLYADFYSDNYTSLYEYFKESGELRPGDRQTRIRTRFYQGSVKGIFNIGNMNKLSAGIEYLTDCLDDYMSSSATLAHPVSNYTVSAYLQDDIRFHKNWTALAGVRWLYHEKTGHHATPNLALMFHTGGFRARASFATGYKTPSLADIYTFNVSKSGSLTIGNENLRPEKSLYGSLNAEYSDNRVSVSATGFINYLRDKIEVESFEVGDEELRHYQELYGEDVTDPIIKKRSNIDRARVAGLTVSARIYCGAGISLSGAYNFIDARNLSAEEGADNRLDKSIRHSGNASAQWDRTWDFYTLNVNLSGEVRGRRFSSTYSPRIGDAPAYTLWNLHTSHTFNLGSIVLVPGIGVDNIFNYRDDHYAYMHYINSKGEGAVSMAPYATLTPGITYYVSLKVCFKGK